MLHKCMSDITKLVTLYSLFSVHLESSRPDKDRTRVSEFSETLLFVNDFLQVTTTTFVAFAGLFRFQGTKKIGNYKNYCN